MKIIFGKHDGCSTDFCWIVPENAEYDISKGDILLVQTQRGLDIATATTDVISGDGVLAVAIKAGAYLPLKKVVTYADSKMQQYIENRFGNEIINEIRARQTDTIELAF